VTGIERIRYVFVAIVVPAILVGCNDVGPPPPGAKIVRVRPGSLYSGSSSALAPVERSSSPPASRTSPLPDEVEAIVPIPGCKCGSGYHPVAAAEPFYRASLSATGEGRFGDALDAASRAVSVGLGLDVYNNQLAIALFNAGRAEEALAKWQDIAQGPAGGCELGFYADALQRLGRSVEAESIARRYVRQCGRSSSAHYLLASVLNDLGRFESAEQEATEAINLDAEDALAYRLRSIIRERRNLLDVSLSDARMALKLKPDSGDNHHLEASVLWAMGRYSEAEQPITTAAKLSPRDAGIQYFGSMILEQTDELDEALQAAKEAVEIDGKNANHLRQLGDVYEALRRPAEAIQAFDRSLALQFAPEALFSRAMCHNEIGQREAALRDLQELERKSPGFQNTRDWIESLEAP
jgi:tetratricopeptide (TPR) repeat protein